ncbi:hypothetical protein SALWKB29_1801 [Snodgrassella communis]|uniref:Uncharacterized protein n=1 Tax=Snodgrassella communis TaxID=2946699 RepID=A0A836Z5R8_9NEIS|nr:hypothetical protein SALWKB29_1801 [Snodgrassella communis]
MRQKYIPWPAGYGFSQIGGIFLLVVDSEAECGTLLLP